MPFSRLTSLAEDKCEICTNNIFYSDNAPICRLLPCKHQFHAECLGRWIPTSISLICPTCHQGIDEFQDPYRKSPIPELRILTDESTLEPAANPWEYDEDRVREHSPLEKLAVNCDWDPAVVDPLYCEEGPLLDGANWRGLDPRINMDLPATLSDNFDDEFSRLVQLLDHLELGDLSPESREFPATEEITRVLTTHHIDLDGNITRIQSPFASIPRPSTHEEWKALFLTPRFRHYVVFGATLDDFDEQDQVELVTNLRWKICRMGIEFMGDSLNPGAREAELKDCTSGDLGFMAVPLGMAECGMDDKFSSGRLWESLGAIDIVSCRTL